MILYNGNFGQKNWFYLSIVLPCILLFISCVPTTYNSTGSVNVRPVNVYNEIKVLSTKLSTTSDETDAEMLIRKSQDFVKAYPKYRKVDEIYLILGQTLLQFDRAAEAIPY